MPFFLTAGWLLLLRFRHVLAMLIHKFVGSKRAVEEAREARYEGSIAFGMVVSYVCRDVVGTQA